MPLAEHIRLESLEGKFLRLSYCLPWGSAYRDSALVLNLALLFAFAHAPGMLQIFTAPTEAR